MSKQPAAIVTAEDLLAKMRAGTKELHEIRLRDLVIPVRVLSIDETNAIRRQAIQDATMKSGDEVDKNVAIQKSTLKLASTMTKGGGPMLSDKLLNMMSVDELGFLYEEYIKVMDDVNPSIDRMTEDQFKVLVEAVKKNHLSARDLSLSQLKAIFSAFQGLIQRLETPDSQKAN